MVRYLAFHGHPAKETVAPFAYAKISRTALPFPSSVA
jgi:hypothetical protein